ncbi:MAG: hypothetical protein DHS20C15_05860 [Planctomycetota bacterium]|nr:MAG: hypothetical protein DHS20C15_05860 [Planctomycetota bacterium]
MVRTLKRRAPQLAWAAFALCVLWACGERASAPELQRGRWNLAAGGASAPERRVVERFDLLEQRTEWEVESPSKRIVVEGPELPQGSRPMLVVGAGRRERVVQLTRAGHYDPATFDRVEVWLSADGGGGLGMVVDLLRDGAVVNSLRAPSIDTLDRLVNVSVDLPAALRSAAPFDALRLRFLGSYRRFALRDVALVDEPRAARLPDPAAQAELVVVGDQARPAVGLLQGRALQTELALPHDARVQFDVAWTSELAAVAPQGAVLRVELLTDSGRELLVEHELLPSVDRWTPLELTLPASSSPKRLELSLQSEAHAAAGTSLACLVSAPQVWVPRARPPVTVLITSDTHRADHVGYAEQGVSLSTPVLDALAARGTRYLDAYTSVNNTNPSHVALMTGTSPRDTGVLSNYDGVGAAAATLAESFASAGYTCVAALSTRHLGPPGSGLGQGFDRISWPTNTPQRPSTETLPILSTWLDELHDRPLFVWLHVFDAHTPYTPPDTAAARQWDPARDAFDPALPEPVPTQLLPPELTGLRELDWARAMYRAEIEEQDARLGAFLAHPRLSDALIAFVSDHGELLGENGVYFNHIGAYPKTLHVPLVLAGPGVSAGEVVASPVSHLDLGRSLLDLSGLTAQAFPGRALPTAARAGRAAPRFAIESFGASATVQHEDLFLVLSLVDRALPNMALQHVAHEVELYDLSTDPEAAHNLVDERFDDAARLRALVLDWLAQRRALPWRDTLDHDAAQLEELAALGYVAPVGGGLDADALWQPDDCAWCARFDTR